MVAEVTVFEMGELFAESFFESKSHWSSPWYLGRSHPSVAVSSGEGNSHQWDLNPHSLSRNRF